MKRENLIKINLILCFLLFSNLIFAQSKKENHRVYGIEIQPKVSILILEDEEIGEASNKAGAAVSGLVFFKLHNQLSFKTGLGINLTRISQKDYSPLFACDFNGMTADPLNSWQTLDFSIYYLSVPAHLKWDFNDKERHPYIRIGADFLFKIGSRGSQIIHECGTNPLESNSPTRDFSPFLIFTGLGIGYEFALKENRQFYIEPNIAYALKPVFKEKLGFLGNQKVPYNSNILNISLAAGIKF